ncbi:hypothetical protein [Rhizobium rhizoryzae]|uniref:hypothetical protein n=1 Tax=Rhizobium rhizoryzae TaxID=451876 RepID=UPI00406B9536
MQWTTTRSLSASNPLAGHLLLASYKPDAQRRCSGNDFQQAVNIGMGTGAVSGIGGMFGKNVEGVGSRLAVQCSKRLLYVLIDSQRTLLAWLIFDGCDNSASLIDKIYTRQAFNRWQQLQIILERRRGLDHRWSLFS